MCIIISKVAEAQHPTNEILEQCWRRNPDGAGIAYASNDGGINVVKGLMTLKDLIAAMDVVREVPTSMYVVHFRIGTHGNKDETNTHPFWVKDGKLAIVHNGILPFSSMLDTTSKVSDTNGFVEEVLKKLPEGWEKSKVWAHVIEEYMGAGNKIATITNESIQLLNPTAWNTDVATGLTYSNMSWKVIPTYVPAAYTPTDYSRTPYYQKPIQGDFLKGKKGTANKYAKRTSDIGLCHKRMLSMIKQGSMTASNRLDIGALFRDQMIDPHEAEEVLDFVQEAIKALPDKIHNLDETMTSVQMTTILELVDHVMAMSSKSAQLDLQETTEVQPPGMDYGDYDYGGAETPEGYNQQNCLCFVGQLVKVKSGGFRPEEKIVRIERLTSHGFHYVSPDEHTGFMVYSYAETITQLDRYFRPDRHSVEDIIGCTVYVFADGNPYIAVLNAVKTNDSGHTVVHMCLGTGVIVVEELPNIKDLYLLAEPVKLLTAGGSTGA
jgi:hypothetical protein